MNEKVAIALVLALTASCDAPRSAALEDATPSMASAVTTASNASSAPASSAAAQSAPPVAAPEAPPVEVAAQHVLIAYRGAKGAPKSVTRSKADAKKRAEEVAAKAKAGEDFTSLVKAYTDDPGGADRLGSVGKFRREKMDKAFSDAAFALKVDEVSGAVETPFGFHVIKRNQ